MKISLAQLNFHIGNFPENLEKLSRIIREAEERKVDLVVFPELSVCGYPPLDLLEQKDFIDACLDAIHTLARVSPTTGVIVGGPDINPDPKGKRLYNTAFFLYGGMVAERRFKTLLPTYDIFDEYRYFEPNRQFSVVEFKGHRIALTICEDLWDDQPVENAYARTKLYPVSPMEKLILHHPDILINISASPFAANRIFAREEVVRFNAQKYGLPMFYCNQVGAQTELIFDGGSMVVSPEGKILDLFTPFIEEVRDYDLEDVMNVMVGSEVKYHNQTDEYRIEMIYKALIFGIQDYFRKMNFGKATLGLSGGIDSAVTLVLAAEALGAENVHVLLMPSAYSSDHSVTDSVDLAERLQVTWTQIPIEPICASVNRQLDPLFSGLNPDVTEENIQARIRGVLLMALSNKKGMILLNTSNKSEAAVGYATLYGDMNGGLSVLGDVYKTDVYRLARFINRRDLIIPLNSINKPPSAELRPGQKDSDSLPPYEILDTILYRYIEQKLPEMEIAGDELDRELVHRVIQMVNQSEYKRFQAPPILRVSSKAFGMGRRMPLVAKY